MDPLSVTTSVVTLIGTVRQILAVLHQREISSSTELRKELKILIDDFQSLRGLLLDLSHVADQEGWDSKRSQAFAKTLYPLLTEIAEVTSLTQILLSRPTNKTFWRVITTSSNFQKLKITLDAIQSVLSQVLNIELAASVEDFAARVGTYQVQVRLALNEEPTTISKELELSDYGLLLNTDWTYQFTKSVTESSKLDISEWLSPVDFQSRQKDIYGKRIPETGLWILSRPEFQKWLNGKGRLLWCPGAPGSGKTVIASTIINYVQRIIERGQLMGALAFIYFNYGDQTEQTTRKLISSLLCQLFEQSATPSDAVQRLYERHISQGTEPGLHELTEVLLQISQTFSKVWIIIDALDECQVGNGTRHEFLSILQQLSPHANILITARFVIDVPIALAQDPEHFGSCEVSPSSQDMRLFVLYKLQRQGSLSRLLNDDDEYRTTTIVQILDISQNSFIMAQTILNTLGNARTRKALKFKLSSGPKSLTALYELLLLTIKAEDKEVVQLAMEALLWVVYAQRPLTVDELRYALAIPNLGQPFSPDDLVDIDGILEVCSPFVAVDQSTRSVRLVHYSAREYLEHREDLFPDGHNHILKKCLACLSLEDSHSPGPCSSDKELESRLQANPFLGYAASNWAKHVTAYTPSDIQRQIVDLMSNGNVLGKIIQILHIPDFPYPNYSQGYPKDAHALHIVAVSGLVDALNSLLSKTQQADIKSQFYGTALQAAALNGNLEAMKLLLKSGANINAQSGRYCTALQAASYGGWEEVVNFLLGQRDPKADLNTLGGIYDTALQAATSEKHLSIASKLLASGALVNEKRKGGLTALHRAAFHGDVSMVCLILKYGGEVDARDGKFGRTPLAFAAWNGHLDTVKLLAEKGANINAADSQNSTPLHLALERHQQIVARFLIDKEARLDVVNDAQKTQAQLALDSIEKIDTKNFALDEELSLTLSKGFQATSIEVYRRRDDPDGLKVR